MKWFEGEIGSAVQLSKSKHVILMVYIEGQDELSEKMNSTWSDSSVANKCETSDFICIKLKANSDVTAQFCQIYPVVCVPCTYFIGENGIPLEVTGGHVEPQQFVEKIDSVIQMHKAQLESQPGKSEQSSAPQASASPERSAAEAEAAAASAEPSKPADPLEKRVEKVQEMINKKREQRQKEEQEKEFKKEKERIQMGREMAKLKNFQEKKEAEELREQMKKDKLEEKLARQRIKEQIARDRADRAAKYEKEKLEKQQAKELKEEAKATAAKEEQSQFEARRRETASIQFRLPDGSRITNRFQSSDTLGDARAFLLERVGSSLPSVKLCNTYPKRDFTESDMSQSLLDLDLAPSAALIVLPGGSRSVAPRSGDGGENGGFIWMLFAPLIAIWNFIYNFLFAAPPAQPEPSQASAATSSQPPSGQTSARSRPKSSYGVRSRRQGNMYRLSADDEDDESATWNGNSTQQM